MHDTGRRECRIAGCKNLRLVVYPHHALAFENYIQLVLPLMGVRGVLLSGLERVQSREEEVALHQRGFSHLVGCKLRPAGDFIQKHMRHFISAVIFPGQCAAGSRSITINVNDPGRTGGLPLPGVPAGTGPNFAETTNTR